MSNWPAHASLALTAGIGIPVLASINTAMGSRLHSPVAASVILCLVGTLACLSAFSLSPDTFAAVRTRLPATVWLYAGGLCFAFYVLSITWLVPRFGLGNAIFFVLLGQIVSATLIDHFGWFDTPRFPADPVRLLGITVMLVGVMLARRPPG